MARIQPARSRAEVVRESGRLRIAIRAPRNWFVIPFLTGWLGGWAMGEGFAVRQLFFGRGPVAANAFLFFWLVAWTIGGAFALYALAWMVVGREVITLDGRTLTVRQSAGPVGRTREFDLAQSAVGSEVVQFPEQVVREGWS